MSTTATAPKKSKGKAQNTANRQPDPEVNPQPKQEEFVMSDEQELRFLMYSFCDKIDKVNRRLASAIQLLSTHDDGDEPFDGHDAFAVDTAVCGASSLLDDLHKEMTTAVSEFMRLFPWRDQVAKREGYKDEPGAAMKMIAELPPEARSYFVFDEPDEGSQIDSPNNIQGIIFRSITEMLNHGMPLLPMVHHACAMAKAMPSARPEKKAVRK